MPTRSALACLAAVSLAACSSHTPYTLEGDPTTYRVPVEIDTYDAVDVLLVLDDRPARLPHEHAPLHR